MYVNHMVDRLQPEVFDYLNILELSNILNRIKYSFYLNRKITINHLHVDYPGIN